MTATEETTEELVGRSWIYLGRYAHPKGLGSRWLDHNDKPAWFAKGPKDAIVGGRYLVDCTADSGRAVVRGARYEAKADVGDGQLAEWRLEDRRAYLEDEGRKAVARAKRDNGDIGALTLDQVRRLLLTAGGLRRGALLAAVLGYIEGGHL